MARIPGLIPFSADDEEIDQAHVRQCCAANHKAILIYRQRQDNILDGPSAARSSSPTAWPPTSRCVSWASRLNIDRPNDMLWAITMNNTKTSPDLVSRGLPIRLQYEGRPEDRELRQSRPDRVRDGTPR